MAIADLSNLGTSGIKQYSGVVAQELHPRLRGQLGQRVFQEMADNDYIIGATLFAIENWITAVPWRMEPAQKNSAVADAWAEYVDGCRHDMSHTWSDFVADVLTFLVHGWSYFELVYKVRCGMNSDPRYNSRFDDGLIGWRKIQQRAQNTRIRWEFDTDGGIRGMWQQPQLTDGTLSSSEVFLPIEKCLLFRTKIAGNNPEGRSLLRNAAIAYWRKTRIEDIEAVGIERDLSGYPVMQVPLEVIAAASTYLDDNASDDQRILSTLAKGQLEECKRLVTDIRRDEREGAVVPSELDADGKPTGYKLSLLSSGGSRSIDCDKAIRRYESRMAMSMLCEFILVGLDKGGGSFALHESKTDAFSLALQGYLDRIGEVLQRFAVRRLCLMNGCPQEMVPLIKHDKVNAPPLQEVSAYVQQLATSGMLMHDVKTEDYLREKGGLPVRAEEMPAAPRGRPQVGAGAAADATATPTPQDQTTVQDKTLNGAQIAQAVSIVSQVTQGLIPRDSGLKLLTMAFAIDPAVAEGIMGSAGQGFVPSASVKDESLPATDADTGGGVTKRIHTAAPETVRDNIKEGLRLYEQRQHGKGLSQATVAWATRLSLGEPADKAKLQAMVRYFSTHAKDKRDGWNDPPTPGYVAWQLWGGDAGQTWASQMLASLKG